MNNPRACIGLSLAISVSGALGCTESGAGKAWSSLSYCVLGQGATLAPAEQLKALRAIQLSNPNSDGKADAWPGQCSVYANQLYQALESSGKQAVLKRTMQSKFGCSDAKPTCVLNSDTVGRLVGEVAEGAKAAELKLEPAPAVKAPEVSVQVALSAQDWQPMTKPAMQLVGPEVLPSGDVKWLLKSTGERMRPTGCVFSASSKQIECVASNEKVPPLPPQSIQLVSDDKETVAAGLTEQGQAAFNLKTGDAVTAKGLAGNLVADGLSVERGEGDKGFVAIPITKGKAGKPIELKSKAVITQPQSIGSQIFWLEPGEGSTTFVAKTLKNNKLGDAATLTGAFAGPFHVCRSAGLTAVATWGLHQGQRGAKPSAGSDGTQVTVTLLSEGGWSKPIETKIPFRRAIDSELVCADATAKLAWAEPIEGGVKLGVLTCDKGGCKTTEEQLPGVDSRWWWAVGPVGDKLLVMWRASLGEARMRLGVMGQLAQAKDVVLFDDPDHGGPKAGEATSVFTKDAALLLFKLEPPVAMSIAADGSARILTAK